MPVQQRCLSLKLNSRADPNALLKLNSRADPNALKKIKTKLFLDCEGGGWNNFI